MSTAKKLRILVVEDDRKTVVLYRRYLSEDVFIIEYAADGEAAIAAYDRQKPDIVMLDLSLPGPGGMEILRHIRKKHSDLATTVIVATARHRDDLRRECEDLIVQGYLIKPFDLKTINNAILELHGYKGMELDLDYDQKESERLRLLIAEDDKKLAVIYNKFLPKEIFKVRIEEDGRAALAAYRSWKPDIVILDLLMPNMSGMEFLEEIREKEGDFYLTIIVASGERKAEAVKQCAKFDIQGYLLKPLDVQALAQTILAHHKRHQADLYKKGWGTNW